VLNKLSSKQNIDCRKKEPLACYAIPKLAWMRMECDNMLGNAGIKLKGIRIRRQRYGY